MIKKILIGLIFIPTVAYSAIEAVTENGETVILNENGTWAYQDTQSNALEDISINENKFYKSDASKFNLKSKITGASFWVNPKEWRFNKQKDDNEPSEYLFSVPNTDLYGMVITEQIQMQPAELAKIAFQNAKNVAPDMRVVQKEIRNVNGNDVIYMMMQGTVQSIDFTYVGYYHSDSRGSTQFLTYTGTNLIPKYEEKIFSLLNGFDTKNNE